MKRGFLGSFWLVLVGAVASILDVDALVAGLNTPQQIKLLTVFTLIGFPAALVVLTWVFEGLRRDVENGALAREPVEFRSINEDPIPAGMTVMLAWFIDQELVAVTLGLVEQNVLHYDPPRTAPGGPIIADLQPTHWAVRP